MKNPTRCESPVCGSWTFRTDGYCSDECARIVPQSAARGIGIVTPPPTVRVSRARRVRRSDGYIARNGAWIATAEAGFLELSRDCRDLDQKQRKHHERAERSIARTDYAHRITAADLPAANGGNPEA